MEELDYPVSRLCSNCEENWVFDKYKQCRKCRDEKAAKKREWIEKHPEYNAVYLKTWNRKRRETVLEHYGGHCACCGEDTYEFLAIDHKKGGGEKHRSEVGQGSRMVDWIINNGFPEDFQILCHNCNQAIGYYGLCPHEREVKLVVVRDE